MFKMYRKAEAKFNCKKKKRLILTCSFQKLEKSVKTVTFIFIYRETERDRPIIAAQIQKELNLRVLEWGIEIGEVTL